MKDFVLSENGEVISRKEWDEAHGVGNGVFVPSASKSTKSGRKLYSPPEKIATHAHWKSVCQSIALYAVD